MTYLDSGKELSSGDIDSLVKKRLIRIGFKFSINENNLTQFATDVLQTTTTLKTLQLDTASILENESYRTALAQNRTIEFLNLRGSRCDDDGAIALATILKTNSTLQTISLNDNHITDVGAKVLAEALVMNRTLQKIYLNDNLIDEEGAKALTDVLREGKNNGTSSLQIISLRGNNFDNDEEGKEVFQDDEWSEDEEDMIEEKSPKTSSSATGFNRVRRANDDDTNMLDPQVDINTLLAEKKLMQQQLDNLSTARTEARDELAAKDAMLRMRDATISTLGGQFDRYKREAEKASVEKEGIIQQLKEELASKDVEAAAKAATKDAELKTKLEEIFNMHEKELEQTEAARVAAESKAIAKDEELRTKNGLIVMKDAELFQLRNQLSIQHIAGQQQMTQVVHKFNGDIASAKAREASKDAELRRANDLLKSKEDELSNYRVRLNDCMVVMTTRGTELSNLKKMNEDLSAEIKINDEELSDHRKQVNDLQVEMTAKDLELSNLKTLNEGLSAENSQLTAQVKSLNEMKRQVEQSVQNAELVARESNLKSMNEDLTAENGQLARESNLRKMNEDLTAENSQLTAKVKSLNERIKYSKVVDVVDLTTDVAADKSGDTPQQEGLPSKRRRRLSGDDGSMDQTADNEGNKNVDRRLHSQFNEAIEKHKTDIFEVLRQAASRGEETVSVDAIVQTRRNNVTDLKRAQPSLTGGEIAAAFAKAECDAHLAFARTVRQSESQNRSCDAPIVHRPNE